MHVAIGLGLLDHDLVIDAVLQFLHMRNQPDEAVVLRKLFQNLQRLFQRFGVKRSETLVDEQGIQLHRHPHSAG